MLPYVLWLVQYENIRFYSQNNDYFANYTHILYTKIYIINSLANFSKVPYIVFIMGAILKEKNEINMLLNY